MSQFQVEAVQARVKQCLAQNSANIEGDHHIHHLYILSLISSLLL